MKIEWEKEKLKIEQEGKNGKEREGESVTEINLIGLRTNFRSRKIISPKQSS